MQENDNINQDKIKQQSSSQDSFVESNSFTSKHTKSKQQVSQFFSQYSQVLSKISVNDCLTKFKQQLKAQKINFNQRCFQPEMSLVIIKHTKNYGAVTLFVSFSHFSFEISAVNLFEQSFSESCLQTLGKGSYGIIYEAKINNSNVAIKVIQYSDDYGGQQSIDGRNAISKAIFQYCLYKLFSVLQIGPKIVNILGFDLLISKNTIQFSMQKCEKGHNKSLESLFQSLDIMHSLGIIHGDIKSDNIMWSPFYQKLVFIDFGFSQVLRQKPGEKTLTNYFGTFQSCSNQMKSLFHGSKREFVDLYYNDLFGLKFVSNVVFSAKQVIKKKKQKLVFSPREYINFIQNSQLCFIFYTLNQDSFQTFCQQLNKNFTFLLQFWNIIKNTDKLVKKLVMIQKLSKLIFDPENVLSQYLASYTKNKLKIVQQRNYLWRFKQRANNFNGAINDIMLFSLIYYNFDISPHRYSDKEVLLKTLMSKFEPSDKYFWKDLIQLLKNPYTTFKEVISVFENIKKTIGIKVWVKFGIKQYELHLKGAQIAGICLYKYGFNLFELNQKSEFKDKSQQSQYIKHGIIRIFKYEEYSNLIKLHSNDFPYLSLLNSLKNDLNKQSLISNCETNIQRLKQNYKIKDQLSALKLFQNALKLEYSFNQNTQIKNILSEFQSNLSFELLQYSKQVLLIKHFGSTFSLLKPNQKLETTQRYQTSKSLFSIFQIQKSIKIFLQENYTWVKLKIQQDNVLEKLTQNFNKIFQPLLPHSQYKLYYFLTNFNNIYSLNSKRQFSTGALYQIQAKILEIIDQVIYTQITFKELFLFICSFFINMKNKNPLYLKAKNYQRPLKALIQYFLNQQVQPISKVFIIFLKLRLHQILSLFKNNEYENLLTQTVNFIIKIESQDEKLHLFYCSEILVILLKHFSFINSIESKKQKQKLLNIVIKYSYHQNGNLSLFSLIMEIITHYFCYGESCQSYQFIKLVIQGTYFKNQQKQYTQEMQKFVTAEQAIELFIRKSKNKTNGNFKTYVFQFIQKGINTQKEHFFKQNGNLILFIEKIFKEFFLKHIQLSSSEIIWLLKMSSQFINYSNLSFTRSFYLAMSFWCLQIAIQIQMNLNVRKLNIINSRLVRNCQYIVLDLFLHEYQNSMKFMLPISNSKKNKIHKYWKNKILAIGQIKVVSIQKTTIQEKSRFLNYLHLLYQRPSPDTSILMNPQKNELTNNKNANKFEITFN